MLSSLQTVRKLMAMYIAMIFIFIGNGLVMSSAGIGLKDLGANNFETGLVTSCFFLGAMTCTFLSPKLISRFGHIRAYSILTAVFAVTAIMHGLSSSIIYWAILRFILGYCYYSLVMITESWMNEKAQNHNRSTILSIYNFLYYVSFAFGVLILRFDFSMNTLFIIAASSLILGLIPFNIFDDVEAPLTPPKQKITIPNIFHVTPLSIIAAFIAGIVLNGFVSMATVYILNQGYGAKEVSTFITISMVGSFISQLLMGSLSDKIGRKEAMIIVSFVTLGASSFLLFGEIGVTSQNIIGFFIGFGVAPLYVLALARANDVVEDKNDIINIGRTVLFAYLVGSVCSPVLLGGSMSLFGSKGFALVYFIAAIFLIIYTLFRRSIPREQRKAYVPVQGSSVVFEEEKEENDGK